jgi:hypothetical protein
MVSLMEKSLCTAKSLMPESESNNGEKPALLNLEECRYCCFASQLQELKTTVPQNESSTKETPSFICHCEDSVFNRRTCAAFRDFPDDPDSSSRRSPVFLGK